MRNPGFGGFKRFSGGQDEGGVLYCLLRRHYDRLPGRFSLRIIHL
jgi:hypothetical protein